jgi:hypothetical protein
MAMKCIEMIDWGMVAVPLCFLNPFEFCKCKLLNVAPEGILPPMG